MEKAGLGGRSGAGFDPCAAIQHVVELAPGEEREVLVVFGQGDDRDEALRLVERYRAPGAAGAAYDEVTGWWRNLLGTVRVKTPEPQIDLLLNGWLQYQTLACRVWGRSAFYQSGGAYGFRDQLQDVMALTTAAPALVREQILRAAQRQFVEGDVQHWWHPPAGRGIRTRFSDDFLWLPFVTSSYVTATGDTAILDEVVPFLEGRPLREDEDEYYDLPTVSHEHGTLYEHCVRAIEHGLRFGTHDLPLMGTGDWNDGMNLVGHEGKGESVWAGWFLLPILRDFATLAAACDDPARARRYRAEEERLRSALEAGAWDGDWYLRAFYDDGTPLGSARNDECRIDSLAQSWAVISGGGDPERARQAMAAVDEHLIDHEAGLIRLFTPPFDHSPQEPGYIKGYVPGVRENGGQYTHAAIWVIWAYALLGDGARAGELFQMINPIRHAITSPDVYKVEPYVVAADVYAQPPHTGRGGWTWYTGSAAWLYRLGVEMVLGLRREGDCLRVAPCIPPEWPGFEITYRHGTSSYHITVENPHGLARGTQTVVVDGEVMPDGAIPIDGGGGDHEVRIMMLP
jgi:cellobiose phosphorylase